MTIAARCWEHANFQGRYFDIQLGVSNTYIGDEFNDVITSIKVFLSPGEQSQWIAFYEDSNYGEDSLWIEVNQGTSIGIGNLYEIRRPHGDNHWNDKISSYSFSGPPPGDHDEQTRIYADGRCYWGDNGFDAPGTLTRGNEPPPG